MAQEVRVSELVKGRRITGSERVKLGRDLKKRYEAGASIRDLAGDTSRSYGFIHRVLTDEGVTLRGRGGATRSKAGQNGSGSPKTATAGGSAENARSK